MVELIAEIGIIIVFGMLSWRIKNNPYYTSIFKAYLIALLLLGAVTFQRHHAQGITLEVLKTDTILSFKFGSVLAFLLLVFAFYYDFLSVDP